MMRHLWQEDDYYLTEFCRIVLLNISLYELYSIKVACQVVSENFQKHISSVYPIHLLPYVEWPLLKCSFESEALGTK